MRQLVFSIFLVVAAVGSGSVEAQEPIRLASSPALSPDGKTLAFSWRGDIWTVSSAGGAARQLTTAPSAEDHPVFSPAGKQIAFVSDRAGSRQVYVVNVNGGTPRQLTFHSEGCLLADWFPDGESLLISAQRDQFWRHAQRFFQIEDKPRSAERLLFNAYGRDGKLSPQGNRLLFTREGEPWWRKGYRGSRASQIWICDLESREFTKLVHRETECRSPLWKPDGQGFYYVGGQSGSFNLWEHTLQSGRERRLTRFKDDSVAMPCISRDDSTIIFRHLFDFYRLRPRKDKKPQRLKIVFHGDRQREPIERRLWTTATDVAFSDDGLEIALIAGGDLWVMDTALREPRQITATPEEENEPVFAPDGQSILFVSDAKGQRDIWKATRTDTDAYWWQNERFQLERLTHEATVESNLQWSPAGDLVAFVRERGDLWVMRPDGKDARRLLQSWNKPDYDWSPDGKWIVYAISDVEFNRDVHLLPSDGSRAPFNLSRHPDNDYGPAWSPDGKSISFTGRRLGDEVDIYYVHLQAEQSEQSSRDRKMEKAIEKIQKVRKAKPKPAQASATKPDGSAKADNSSEQDGKDESDDKGKKKLPEVSIDFQDIHERIRRVSVPDTTEANLFWSHDSKKLAFTATVDGKRGTYTISPPDDLKPKLLSTRTGSHARWIAQGNQIVWLSDEKPASLSDKGQATSYSFSALQQVNLAARYKAAFDQCWRAMRDHYYDGNLNNRNWDAIRRKYVPLARTSVDGQMFSQAVSLMLGELNGSHLGFYVRSSSKLDSKQWRETTAHLGVRFDANHKGPGLLVKDVIPKGPADKVKSRILADETILSIDGRKVDPAMDLTTVLNGPLSRDVRLKVRDAEGNDRAVTIRPLSYSAARSLLYEKWVRDNRQQVEQAAAGKLGYLHIRGMNMSSFYRFERELYAVAAGKDGIVIDVRENGGGFTTDHLLTVLTQPAHAITVPRGGQPGYPQDRKVYVSWRKPIVVLCNQNSLSNAEIFSHAIKTLRRGRLVGVPTAGGVISTGTVRIMDVGSLRMPFRGWFLLNNGADMELNGAVPHHMLWPEPGEIPEGQDRQLVKAIQVLKKEMKRWQRQPRPTPRKASERDAVSHYKPFPQFREG